MKKIILSLAVLISIHALGQNTNFRTIKTTGAAQQVTSGYTNPKQINIVNDTATVLFVKCYDQTLVPYAALTHPVLTFMVPASSSLTINLNTFIFKNALWIRIGKGVLDADSTFNKFKSITPIVEITY